MGGSAKYSEHLEIGVMVERNSARKDTARSKRGREYGAELGLGAGTGGVGGVGSCCLVNRVWRENTTPGVSGE